MSSLRQHGGVAVRQATRKLSARPVPGKAEQPSPLKKPQAWHERNAPAVAVASAGVAKEPTPARTEVRAVARPTGGATGTRSESSLTHALSRLAIAKTTQAPPPPRRTRPFSTSSYRRDDPTAGGAGSHRKLNTLEDVARLIRDGHCKNIVLMAGAGLSTASGIPDFRTPGTGLYDNLQRYQLPYPEAVFDLDFFSVNPKPFFTLAQELYPGKCRPNDAHYFARLLHERRLLARLYTQNIDGLERLAGLPPEMLVEAHGTFSTATCTECRKPYPGDQVRRTVMSGKIPYCGVCSAVVKPDIVFFGEDLPKRFYAHSKDFSMADLLIVIGTSLEVMPFASLVGAVRRGVPRLLLNREAVGLFRHASSSPTDVAHLDDVVAGVRRLARLLGWDAELDGLASAGNERLDKELATRDEGPPDDETTGAGSHNRPGQKPSGGGDSTGRRGLHTVSRVASTASTAPAAVKPWSGGVAPRAIVRQQNAPSPAINDGSSESDSTSSSSSSSASSDS